MQTLALEDFFGYDRKNIHNWHIVHVRKWNMPKGMNTAKKNIRKAEPDWRGSCSSQVYIQ